MTDTTLETQKPLKEKITFKVVTISIAAILLYGILSGFRSDFSEVIGIINFTSDKLSYIDLQTANTVCKIVTAFALPIVAFATIKISNFFVLTTGFITTIAGLLCISIASSLPLLIIGLGVLFAVGTAALSFGVIFGIVSPLLGEKTAIIVSTILNIACTFFGVIFSPLIQWCSNIFGYQGMIILFCLVLICIFPLVFLLTGKKKEKTINEKKAKIKMKKAFSIIFKSKTTYFLLVLFFILGFVNGFTNHFYTGMLLLELPSMGVSIAFSVLKIVAAVGSIVLTIVVLRIKKTLSFCAIFLLLFGIAEAFIYWIPKDSLAFLPYVCMSVFIFSVFYPLGTLISRREYDPILIASVIGLGAFIEKVGNGVNSILGSISLETFGSFDMMIFLESGVTLIFALLIFAYIIVSKIKNKDIVDSKKTE